MNPKKNANNPEKNFVVPVESLLQFNAIDNAMKLIDINDKKNPSFIVK